MNPLFDAVLALVREVGYDRMTMDGIAARAKVSKATIYRHWPGKPELVVAAFQERHVEVRIPADTGSLAGDLEDMLSNAAVLCAVDIPLVQSLAFAMHNQPELAELIRAKLLPGFRQPSEEIIRRAVARGELSPDADYGIFHELVPALLAARFLIHGLPITKEYLKQVTEQVLLPVVKGLS